MRWLMCIALLGAVTCSTARAQYDPLNGQWGKDDESHIRVMTWNIKDNIRTEEPKQEGLNSWTAIVMIVAGLQPDVLCLQEAGDNNCHNCVDSVSELETVMDLFFHGGNDPFIGGNVTAYVQLYAPNYDLPYVYVSENTDAYNRNIILSRFPLADLNGDTRCCRSNTPYILPDDYAPGGTGGIRGFMFAEFDLPDDVYAGDLVVGNAHLKCCSDGYGDRLEAAQNVAYYVDYLYNGAGTGIPDPNNKITDSPAATTILGDDTPVVLAGDWNEDEATNGRRGPAEWLAAAAVNGGADGTDRDRSDALYDNSVNPFNGSRATQSSSKLDYIAWQDSIAVLQHSFVFNSSGVPTGSLPLPVQSYQVPSVASSVASDHRPVIADFAVPLAPSNPCPADVDGDGNVTPFDDNVVKSKFGCPVGTGDDLCDRADIDGDGAVNPFDSNTVQANFGPCP